MYTVFFISFVVSSTCFGCYLHPSSGAQLQRTATGCVSAENRGFRTKQRQSCDLGRRPVRFVRLALKVVMQNDRDFINLILIYMLWKGDYSQQRH
jgi:hypothetical protein